jgi:hypothetical protein
MVVRVGIMLDVYIPDLDIVCFQNSGFKDQNHQSSLAFLKTFHLKVFGQCFEARALKLN